MIKLYKIDMDILQILNDVPATEFNTWFSQQYRRSHLESVNELCRAVLTFIEKSGVKKSSFLITYFGEATQIEMQSRYQNTARYVMRDLLLKVFYVCQQDGDDWVLAETIPKFLFSDEYTGYTLSYLFYVYGRHEKSIKTLDTIFDKVYDLGGYDEFCAGFIQLMIIAGFDKQDFSQSMLAFWEEVVANNSHKLSILPLFLLDIENQSHDYFHGRIHCYPEKDVFLDFEALRNNIEVVDVTQKEDVLYVEKAFEKWKEMWCPSIETRLFVFNHEITRKMISPEFLMNLKMDCFAGANKDEIEIVHIQPDEAFRILFGLCVLGPLNNPGSDTYFYARLKTWQSIAGFLGENEHFDLKMIEQEASKAFWAFVRAKSNWFEQQGDDHCILCLHPDRKGMGITAVSTVQS